MRLGAVQDANANSQHLFCNMSKQGEKRGKAKFLIIIILLFHSLVVGITGLLLLFTKSDPLTSCNTHLKVLAVPSKEAFCSKKATEN